MKCTATVVLALAAFLVFTNCGKKNEDTDSPPATAATPTTPAQSVAIGKLAITCGGKSCIGTEAQ